MLGAPWAQRVPGRADLKEAEMVLGKVYALETPGKARARPVTLISKMVMTSRRVRVRVEDPRRDPFEMEVLSRWIKEIRSDLPVAGLELVKSDHFEGPVAWLPSGGEVVERFNVPCRWLVRQIDIAGDRALLDGVLLGVRREEWVPLGVVHRAEIPPRPDVEVAESLLVRHGLSLGLPRRRHVRPTEHRSPAFEEVPEPREISRRLTLGPRARTQYRWISGSKVHEREQFELRREVQEHGRVCWLYEDDSDFLDGEYVRYTVPGRFDVVLFQDPSGDSLQIRVDRIYGIQQRERQPAP